MSRVKKKIQIWSLIILCGRGRFFLPFYMSSIKYKSTKNISVVYLSHFMSNKQKTTNFYRRRVLWPICPIFNIKLCAKSSNVFAKFDGDSFIFGIKSTSAQKAIIKLNHGRVIFSPILALHCLSFMAYEAKSSFSLLTFILLLFFFDEFGERKNTWNVKIGIP